MKPIVSQLNVEPPSSLEEHPNLPSVKEVDDLLVICIGQMVVTASTYVLWKPLSHEVLIEYYKPKLIIHIALRDNEFLILPNLFNSKKFEV